MTENSQKQRQMAAARRHLLALWPDGPPEGTLPRVFAIERAGEGDKTRRLIVDTWWRDGELAGDPFPASWIDRQIDVYLGVGAIEPPPPTRRGRGVESDVRALPAVWVDIDVAGAGHKSQALPPETHTALREINACMDETGLPRPHHVVHSGGGLHCYWLLREPLLIGEPGAPSPTEMAFAKRLLQDMQSIVRRHWQARGWTLDATHDLARVLRLPGTFNHKPGHPEPPLCDILHTVAREDDHAWRMTLPDAHDLAEQVQDVMRSHVGMSLPQAAHTPAQPTPAKQSATPAPIQPAQAPLPAGKLANAGGRNNRLSMIVGGMLERGCEIGEIISEVIRYDREHHTGQPGTPEGPLFCDPAEWPSVAAPNANALSFVANIQRTAANRNPSHTFSLRDKQSAVDLLRSGTGIPSTAPVRADMPPDGRTDEQAVPAPNAPATGAEANGADAAPSPAFDLSHVVQARNEPQTQSNDAPRPLDIFPSALTYIDMTDRRPPPLIGPGHLLKASGKMIVGGPPKSAKSHNTLHMAAHFACGRSFMGLSPGEWRREDMEGYAPRPLATVVVQDEVDKFELRERLSCPSIRALAEDSHCRALLQRNLLLTSPPRDIGISDENAASWGEWIVAACRDAGSMYPDLLIIDPYVHAYTGRSETDVGETTHWLRVTLELLRQSIIEHARRLDPRAYANTPEGPGILIVHHTRKISANDEAAPFETFRGSSALRGWYDAGMVFVPRRHADHPIKHPHGVKSDEPATAHDVLIHIESRTAKAPDPIAARLQNQVGWRALKSISHDGVTAGDKLRDRWAADVYTVAERIIILLLAEAEQGRVYTMRSFAARFASESTYNLPGQAGITQALRQLAAKQVIAFWSAEPYGAEDIDAKSRNTGHIAAMGMVYRTRTGEIAVPQIMRRMHPESGQPREAPRGYTMTPIEHLAPAGVTPRVLTAERQEQIDRAVRAAEIIDPGCFDPLHDAGPGTGKHDADDEIVPW